MTQITEYRINKKGSECFRTRDGKEARARLEALSSKRPGVYTIQYRSVPITKYGVMYTDLSGNPLWSCWS